MQSWKNAWQVGCVFEALTDYVVRSPEVLVTAAPIMNVPPGAEVCVSAGRAATGTVYVPS